MQTAGTYKLQFRKVRKTLMYQAKELGLHPGAMPCVCACVSTCACKCVWWCLHWAESLIGCRFDCHSNERQVMQRELGLVVDRLVGRLSQPSSILTSVYWVLISRRVQCWALDKHYLRNLATTLRWYYYYLQRYLNGDWNFERLNNLPEITQLPT